MLACLDCPVNKQVEEVEEGEACGWYWNDPSDGLSLAAEYSEDGSSNPCGQSKEANKASRIALLRFCDERAELKLEIS
jgi:hypothetical protein